MNRVRVGVGIVNQTPFGWAENEANIRRAIRIARERGVTVLCLPELCITGYGCEDMFQSAGLLETAWDVLERITGEETEGMAVCLGLPVSLRGAVYNCAALAVDGKIAGLVAKRYLAGDGIHYEPRWFKPWPEGVVSSIERRGQRYPIGDMSFDLGGLLLGFEICEDAWVASRPGGNLSRQGIDVILNPSASHFAFGKQDVRRQIVVEGSRAFGVTYLYANLLGNEAGRAIYDGGGILAVGGTPIAESQRFSFDAVQVVDAVADIELTRLQRARSASFRPDVKGDDLHRVPFTFPAVPPQNQPPVVLSDFPKEEAFGRIIALALFDYLRRSFSQGYVVSLSGGADSAACVCLVRLMVDLAIQELGLEGAKKRLGHVRGMAELDDAAAITKRLLTTAYQATRNSGEVTRNAAVSIAAAVGADHLHLDVDSLVMGYRGLIEGAVGRELDWDRDDITLQNIQARARGPSIWMLANMRSQILMATSNRSEAAVGYATMDGDTCGGLSPIAGIDKAFLRRWLRWMETEGIEGIGPIPALSAVNVQQPTAELRPQEEEQTDEGDLMPYPLLDAIERAAIRDKKMPVETFELMRVSFPEVPAKTMRAWVDKFYKLWCRNQWKRERYAPSFHVDDKNLDPKTWCRFPILSGGYGAELQELRELDLE